MAHISPFKGLRPQSELAQKVAALPYDVCSRAEAKQAASSPYNFYHITRSEIDLPDEIDVHSEAVYQKAKENLAKFIQEGILVQDETENYYLYELTMDGRKQTGLLCASSVADYNDGIIKKHEFTRPEKEQDRIRHITTTKAQTGIVFLAYKDEVNVQSIIKNWKEAHNPEYEINADDGILHKVWVVNDEDTVNEINAHFEKNVPHTYIADGHHRAASAAKVAEQLGNEYPNANYFLTCIFPESEVKILDYNRVVTDLNGMNTADFLKAIEEKFIITPKGKEVVKPTVAHSFGMYLDNEWYLLEAKDNSFDANDPIDVLDVQILQKNILTAILDIDDPRTNNRVQFVGGIRGLNALEKLVDSGEMAAAFSCYPVSMSQLLAVADSGNVMPPKSTWFEPKTRDGLVTYLLDR